MRDTLLIIDDIEINRDMLEGILASDYRIIQAGDGIEGMRLLKQEYNNICGVLLDLMMPGKDGCEVLQDMNELGYISQVPVLIISSLDSLVSEKECFELGVTDFIHKPFDKDLVKTRVDNIVNLYQYKFHLEETVNEQMGIIKRRNENILDLMGNIVETRSLESGTHVKRVKEYTNALARQMMRKFPKYGLTPHRVEVITAASVLHDVGKISIPDKILLKPGILTRKEREEMQKHTIAGAALIANVRDMWDDEYGKTSYEICRYHHEKYDGAGYPDGLKGDEIPISAQLVSVADCYDALVSRRCYKEPFSKDMAFNMILRGECGAFSPELMECFRSVITEFETIADKYDEQELEA